FQTASSYRAPVFCSRFGDCGRQRTPQPAPQPPPPGVLSGGGQFQNPQSPIPYQTKDIPVRQFLGGFVASNGVGTGFPRAVLEQLAAGNSGRIFDPAS